MKTAKTLLSRSITLLKKQKRTILLIVLVSATTIAATTIASIWLSRYHNTRFPTLATIYTIGVEAYWDQNLTNQTEKIEWGIIYPPTAINKTIYVHSTSNIPTTLTNQTENWTFTNSTGLEAPELTNRTNYIYLTWDYNNQTLNPNQTIQVTLTLTVGDDPTFLEYLIQNSVANFNFDIIIRAK